MDERAFSGLLDLIYDAALDAGLWPRVLEQLADSVQAGPAALLLQDQTTMLGSGTTIRLDASALATHYREFGKRNPLTARNDIASLNGRLPITIDEHVLDKRALMATEYYNEFFKPNGMHSALMVTIGIHGRSAATVNLMRSERQPQFGDSEAGLMRAFQPHLARSFRMAIRASEAASAGGTLIEVMERSPHGLFLVGADGLVQHANAAGLALLGDGLAIEEGELGGATAAASRALQRLVAVATGGAGGRREGGTLTLARPGGRPLWVAVTPLGRHAARLFDVGPAALVSIGDPDKSQAPDTAVLAQVFDLSPAEIRVAERLLLGETPQQAAAALGISVATARWHLASLFRKTGTDRQPELMRLLLALPAG